MSNRTEAQRKQYRLSVGLRAMTVALAVFAGGVMVFAAATRRAVPYLTSDEVWENIAFRCPSNPLSPERWEEILSGHRIFTVIVLLLCVAILFRFERVCAQIGADNSFSRENANGFRTMAWLALVTAVVYIVKIALYAGRCLSGGFDRAAVVVSVIYGSMIVLFLIFAFLCRSLSKLVFNAYEVKLENELTI